MPYGKPPSKLEMKAYRKAQKAVMEDPKKLEKVQVAFRKKHDYQGTKKTSVSKPKPPPIPANKGGKKIKPTPKPAPPAKKARRKPPPKIQGLDWKMTESVVNKDENYWEWKVKGADWIENAGDTTTYTYEQDPTAKLWHGAVDSSMRAGRIFDDEGMEYTVPEFRKEYKKLQKK